MITSLWAGLKEHFDLWSSIQLISKPVLHFFLLPSLAASPASGCFHNQFALVRAKCLSITSGMPTVGYYFRLPRSKACPCTHLQTGPFHVFVDPFLSPPCVRIATSSSVGEDSPSCSLTNRKCFAGFTFEAASSGCLRFGYILASSSGLCASNTSWPPTVYTIWRYAFLSDGYKKRDSPNSKLSILKRSLNLFFFRYLPGPPPTPSATPCACAASGAT